LMGTIYIAVQEMLNTCRCEFFSFFPHWRLILKNI
jgi:hypothetical protein